MKVGNLLFPNIYSTTQCVRYDVIFYLGINLVDESCAICMNIAVKSLSLFGIGLFI